MQQQALLQETPPPPPPPPPLPDRYAMDVEPVARLVKQRPSLQAEGATIPRSIAACDSFRLNLAAGAFGECLCGHLRTEHDDSPQGHRSEPRPVPAAEAAPLPSLALQSTDLRLLEMEALLEREIDHLRAENERLSAGGAPPGLATGSAAGSTSGSTTGSAALSRSRAASTTLSRSRATSSMLSVEATGLLAEIARSAAANLTDEIMTRS